jgi:hypothetical protein
MHAYIITEEGKALKQTGQKHPVAHTPWSINMDVESAALASMRTRMLKTMFIGCETIFSHKKENENHHTHTKSNRKIKTKAKSGPQRSNHHTQNRIENTVLDSQNKEQEKWVTAFQPPHRRSTKSGPQRSNHHT